MVEGVQERYPTGLSFDTSGPNALKKQITGKLSIVTRYSLPTRSLSDTPTKVNDKTLLLHLCRGSVVGFAREGFRTGLVCSTNESCVPICGGVTQAVVEAGGRQLLDDSRALPILSETSFGPVRCITGNASVTSSKDGSNYGALGVSHVIFAVGPQYGEFTSDRDANIKDDLLMSAYRASIQRAKEKNLQALAFSLLSAGKRSSRWDPQRSLRMAVRSLCEFDEDFGSIKEIHLCAFTADEVVALESIAKDLGLQSYNILL